MMDEARLQAIKDKFLREFGGRVGLVEGDLGQPIKLANVVCSTAVQREWARSWFSCPPGEAAILVQCVKAGAVLETDPVTGRETGRVQVDKALIPPYEQWVYFPQEYEGVRVGYRDGPFPVAWK